MNCPSYNYVMTPLDAECPKCQGKGLPASRVTAAPVPTTGVPTQPLPVAPAPVTSQYVTADVDGDMAADNDDMLGTIGFLLLLGGCYLTFHHAFIFDTTVPAPTWDFMGTKIGGGRVYNVELIARRQNMIIIGVAIALVGAAISVVDYIRNFEKRRISAGDCIGYAVVALLTYWVLSWFN